MPLPGRKPYLFTVGAKKKERSVNKVRRARIRNAVLAVLGLLVVVWSVQYSRIRAQRKQALIEILRLQESVRKFRWDHERCPHDLQELLHPPAGGDPYYRRDLVDPWDAEYEMGCPGRSFPDSADIMSAGPDGELYTVDDVKPH
jgi:hypothetical protein